MTKINLNHGDDWYIQFLNHNVLRMSEYDNPFLRDKNSRHSCRKGLSFSYFTFRLNSCGANL